MVALRNPFKFLDAYTKEDKKFFAGRNEETEQLYEMANNGDLILVVGESGVGKTSLVQCGLANRFLKTDWLDVWVRRGDDFVVCLRDQLIKSLAARGNKSLTGDEIIIQLIQQLYLDSFRPVYLIFDQLEEIFTLGSVDEQEAFYKQIETILESRLSCKIILIIREEFLNKLSDFESVVPELFSRRLTVKRMTRHGAKAVITKAAAGNRIAFKPSEKVITDAILEACMQKEQTVYLPWLQVFLDALWRKAEAKKEEQITFDEALINAVGKIEEVLRTFLIDRVRELAKTEKEDDIWLFLQQFVVDGGLAEERGKRPIREQEIAVVPRDKVRNWLSYFEQRRVLRRIETGQFELAHESLVPIILEHRRYAVRPRHPNPPIKGNPYKGLAAYEEQDHTTFFGRKAITDQLVRKIASERIVAVVGPSGAGKSSIIKAGLLPKLRKDGYLVIAKRPGEHPDQRADEIKAAIANAPEQQKFVLYIDQYEELITRCESQKARDYFITYLKSLIDTQAANEPGAKDIRIILSIRSDFEPQFDFFFPNHWGKGRVTVPGFTPEEIREIIVEPAYQAGLEFKPESLVNIIVEEVSRSSGSLPLLSYTLSQMYIEYDKRTVVKDGFITEQDYNILGGVIGGLRTRANEIYDKSDVANQRTIRNVILRMVSLGAGELAGKRVYEAELVYTKEAENERVKSNLSKFIEKRLVVSGKDDSEHVYYEPAHDALVRSWEKLWIWINTHGKEKLLMQQRLSEAVRNFQVDQVLWHENSWLNVLEEVINSEDNWLNKPETEFVQQSIAKRDELIEKEQVEQRQLLQSAKDRIAQQEREATLNKEKLTYSNRAKKSLIWGIVVAGVLVLVSGFLAWQNSIESDRANIEANRARQEEQKANEQTKLAKDREREANALKDSLAMNNVSLDNSYKKADSLRRKSETNNKTLAAQNTQIGRLLREAEFATQRLTLYNRELSKAKEAADRKGDSIAALYAQYDSVRRSSKWLAYAQTTEAIHPALAYQSAQRALELDADDAKVKAYLNQLAATEKYYESWIISGIRSQVTPDGNYVLTIDQQKVEFWNPNGTRAATPGFRISEGINALKFSPDRDILVIGETTVSLRRPDGSLLPVRVEKPVSFAGFAAGASNQVLVASNDVLRLVTVGTRSEQKLLEKQGAVVDVVSNAGFITVLTEKGVYVLDRKKSGRPAELLINKDETAFLLPSGDGFLVMKNNMINRYNNSLQKIGNGYSVAGFSKDYYTGQSAYFSPDGKKALIVLSSNSSSIKQESYGAITVMLDLTSGTVRPFATEPVNNPRFSADGSRILQYTIGKIVIYDTNGKQLGSLGNNTLFHSWNFLPGTNDILTSSLDRRTKLWTFGTPVSLLQQGKLARFSDDEMKQTKVE
jgi:ABC-type dipeptide/oligopeptide/nickel transport system ATPase component